MKGVKAYNELVELCTKLKDNGSRELVAPILVESRRACRLARDAALRIRSVGMQNYLTEQMGGHGEH